MSWDILPKAKLQYLLTRLKEVFDTKVDKETGKGLSTNDYTTSEKNKLAGIESGAEVNVQSDWGQTTTTEDDYIKNKPILWDMNHDGDYIGASVVGGIDQQGQIIWQATQFYPRMITTASDANRDLYSNATNKVVWIEHSSGASYNLPTTDSYYNIITMVGDADNRKTQLAMSPQGSGVYYRAYDYDHWTNWVSLVTDSTKVSKSGDTMSGNLQINNPSATTSDNDSRLFLGNNIPVGSVGNSRGVLTLYDLNQYQVTLMAGNGSLTADRYISLPNKGGVVALTSDIAVQRYKAQVATTVSSIQIPVPNDNSSNILNGILFSRVWQDPNYGSSLSGSLWWISIRPSNGTAGFRAILTDSDSSLTHISSVSYDSSTQILTVNFVSPATRFCEFIWG